MPRTQKPTTESLQVELASFLATAHGEIREAAEDIVKALNGLIKEGNEKNEKLFKEAIMKAMVVPESSYFNKADKQVQSAMKEILEHAQEFLDATVTDLIALNEKIKQEQKKLKERIKKIEEENKGPSSRRPGTM